jgi:hypothetical protein
MEKIFWITAILLLFAHEAFAQPMQAQRPGGGRPALMADANGDGMLDKAEFLAAAQKRAEQKFLSLDTDGDGRLSRAELQAMRQMNGGNGQHLR